MDFESGYDFAMEKVCVKNLNCEQVQSDVQLLEEVLFRSEADSLAKKQGIVEFYQQWMQLQESLTRFRNKKLYSMFDLKNTCSTCGCITTNIKAHLDAHYRENTISDAQTVKKRKSGAADEQPMSRGCFASQSQWVRSLKCKKDLPFDVICYGRLQGSNGLNLLQERGLLAASANDDNDVFCYAPLFDPTACSSSNKKPHEESMLRSGQWKYMIELFKNKNYGTATFMRELSALDRTVFVRAEDAYDDELCNVCGEPFRVVHSGMVNNADDYVFLDAVFSKKRMVHCTCFSA